MCTSFVVHMDNTIIGMNFDISKRPIKMILQKNSQFLILQYENGEFHPAFGFNNSGTFMNLLMVDPNEEGKYRRGKQCVHIMKLFDEVLSDKIELSSLHEYLHDHTIVNVPNFSVHSMVAGMNQNSFIIEPGRSNINMSEIDHDFMVLTNFSLSDQSHDEHREVRGPGSDRYTQAYEMIQNNKETFSKDVGFSVLEETAQYSGEYPTQLSVISVPAESLIYFTLNGDFNKTFEFSFSDLQIRTSKGFVNSNHCPLTKKGVLLEELEGW